MRCLVAALLLIADIGAAAGPVSSRNVLRLARVTDPVSLDPALALSTEDIMLMLLVHQPLLDVRRGTNLFARGAADWSFSADNRTLIARLRPEVTFSNGRRVTSEDYANAIIRVVEPGIGSWQQAYFSGIRGFDDVAAGRTNRFAGIRTPDAGTLVFEFDRPEPTFPILCGPICIPVLTERATGLADDGARPRLVGCGPYRLAHWRRGCELRFEPNPYYSGESTQPRFERIDLQIGGDEATHLMMFERGELDIANIVGNGVPLSDQGRLNRDPRWRNRIESIPGLNVAFVAINTELPPLNDVRVRRALNFAVDRPRRMLTRLNRFVLGTGPIPPTMPGHDPSLRGYGHDPAKARALLAESGLPLPLRLDLWLGNDQISRMICEGLQADLHDVGVELDLKTVSFGQLLEIAGTRKRAHLSFAIYNPGADPRDLIGTLFDGRALREYEPFNTAFYSHPEVNRCIEEALGATGTVRRIELYRRAERQIVSDAPWIFLGHANLFALRQPWIRGPMLEPLGYYRLDRLWRSE